MTIDRVALASILEHMPFDAGRWVVAGSVPMLVAGLIESVSDVDIVVDETAWLQAVALSGDAPRAGLLGDHIVDIEVSGHPVEVFDGWLGTTADEMLSESVVVEAFRFSPLSRVLASKRQLSRRKDTIHIERLEAHLAGGTPADSG